MSVHLTRRRLLRSGAAVAGAAGAAAAVTTTAGPTVAGPAAAGPAARAAALTPSALVATLRQTLGFGPPGPKGYHKVVLLPGETHVRRTDLGADLGADLRAGQVERTPLLAFAQISDVHVVDAQSPARVEWTDRFEDQGSPDQPTPGVFGAAYRAHEMLTGQVADAMVREINAIGEGPVTHLPLALVVQTGDNSDNSQANEVRWNIDVLDGGTVRVDSGDLTRWEGVADDDLLTYDPSYYHPHGTPVGRSDDVPRSQRGFPTVPGLLDAARRPFTAEGLRVPWYAAFGNHDGLVQGNFPAGTTQLGAIATGSVKVISPPAGANPGAVLAALQSDPASLFATLATSPGARTVTADPERRLLARADIVEEHFTTRGLPVGHGFTAANRADGTAYYSFDQGPFRFVVLDTVNPNGEADGSIDQTQMDWLTALLAASDDHAVLIFSHHTSTTMTNPLVGTGADAEPRVLGDAVLALLLSHGSVIAWVNGHTHKNRISARPAPAGGLWEIGTASHIDWPQQSRLIEVVDNLDGTISIFTTLVDHAGPGVWSGSTADPGSLASLARELASNDNQNPGDANRGGPGDRNVELVRLRPPALVSAGAAGGSTGSAGSAGGVSGETPPGPRQHDTGGLRGKRVRRRRRRRGGRRQPAR